MALIYESGYDYTSVIGDKQIKFRQWTAKDERNYLKLLEKDDSEITDKVIFETLLAPAIEDKEVVLSASEQKKLIIDIRCESISDIIEDEHECISCGKKTDLKVKISEVMSYRKANYEEVQIKDLKFVMGPIRTNKEKDLLKMDKGVVEYIFQDFLLHIHAIEINGELQEKFSHRELNKFIDKLPTKIFDEVFEKYQKMIDEVELEYKWTCPECETKETIDYTYIPNLLWA
jgi:hypothetical protein